MWGVSIENITFSEFRFEGATFGFIDLVGSKGPYYRLRNCTGRMRLQHSVIDRNYSTTAGTAHCSQMPNMNTDVFIENCIFCRASGDNIQIQQTEANGKFYLRDFAIIGNFVDETVAPQSHPDLFQTSNGRSVDMRRGILWQDPNTLNDQGAQGVALGDGQHVDCHMENIFVKCTLPRKISCTSYVGEIKDCCAVGPIILSNRGGGGASVNLNNCIASEIEDEDGDGVFSVDPNLPSQSNTQYGPGNEGTVFQNLSGDYRSWRDYLPVTSRTNGGIDYLNSLVALWDGAGPDPDPPAMGAVRLGGARLVLGGAALIADLGSGA